MRVNYDSVAPTYDEHRGARGPAFDTRTLAELARECEARTVLELGAGTGGKTSGFLAEYPCRIIGLDLSAGMLAKARAKGLGADWIQGSAAHIPLADASVDFVFGVYVLHHLDGLDAPFRECARVLGKGRAVFITAPTDFIERHPMNAYFPSFAKVDLARFQSSEAIREALRRAGFRDICAKRMVAAPRPIDRAFVERVANKFISTYLLIPEDEFTAGLARLRADVREKGRLNVPLVWEALTVWGSIP